ncbi:ammonium transporter [Polycladomyces abyssicola]|uniref:Ammonium transporter n=1 Tax=Polycladomyces abyssicola TaxID=1125966 RepID=A0A8D5UGW1_9BACL|nr:ammonium transporter [Polycladomyces abyssicola]BCU81953.1 ammonium transporter [Polycladomyces abyssicola]
MSVPLLLDTVWVLLAAILVIFMQVGFALLEAGSAHLKHAGHIACKQLISFAVASLFFWAFGYAVTFGAGNDWFGTSGWFLALPDDKGKIPLEVLYLFQLSFAAVSLAIAWGGFAERAKLIVYLLFGALYTSIVYPVVGHWIWGGGWLSKLGAQDFAGSTVVHLQGGIAALIATLLLKPRIGKYGPDGKPKTMQGHNPVFITVGAMIIWLGWFGFNAGSTLGTKDGFFGYVALTTNLAAAAGVLSAWLAVYTMNKKAEIPSIANGALAALVAITAACAFVEPWAAVVIGAVAGAMSVWTAAVLERMGVDDPIGAFSVHGLAGVWGTLSTGFFAAPHLVEYTGIGRPGLFYGGGWTQLGVQALSVLVAAVYVAVVSWAIMWVMDKLFGLRISQEEEIKGLDWSEHGIEPEVVTQDAPTAGKPAAALRASAAGEAI